jgi:hypothetical protein
MRLDLFNQLGRDPDPDSWDSPFRRFFNGRLEKGRNFIRVTCERDCGAGSTAYIEMCCFGTTDGGGSWDQGAA